jgi:hypothetical protein
MATLSTVPVPPASPLVAEITKGLASVPSPENVTFAPASISPVTVFGPGGPGGPVWKILAFAISVGFVWVIVKLPIIAAMVV